MTDPKSPSHWELLASELGVEEPLQEEAPRQPVTPAQPPAPVQKAPSQKPTPPARRQPAATAPQTTSWDSLASELGLAPPPQAVAAPAQSAVAPPVERPITPPEESPMAAAPAAEPGRRGSSVPEAAEDSPNFFDERFDFEEPYDLLESAEAPAAEAETPKPSAESTGEPTGEPTEKRPHRRRRHRGRGRGRGSEQRDSHELSPPEGGDDHPSDAAPEVVAEGAEESDRISVAEEAAGVDIDQPREDAPKSEERHTKRRRSRRGKKKPRSAESVPAAAGAPDEVEPIAEFDESRAMEVVEAGVLAEGHIESDEDDEGDEGPSTRLGFRGIPTWEEAIGMIVDKNLEARSKRSASGSRPGRGKRPPRDNRGGGKRRS